MHFHEYEVDLNADCKCGCMEGDRFHKTYRFENDYGASVVNNPKLKGFSKEGFRILVIKYDGDSYEIDNSIKLKNKLDCNSWDEVVVTLNEIKSL